MAAEFLVVGLSHKTVSLDVREKLAFADADLEDALQQAVRLPSVVEAVLLSTCNRVEFYAVARKGAGQAAVAELRSFLATSRSFDDEQLAEYLYEATSTDAIRHVFRVASSLDSLVVGESQILGQVKSAYGSASRAGSIGPFLSRCLEHAFSAAKRVRTQTAIAKGGANISSVAVELAKGIFDDLGGKRVVVVGAGKMSRLAAQHLRADGAAEIIVTNRSPEKAAELARLVDGKVRPFEDLEPLLQHADIVMSSTGSKEPIVTMASMKKIMRARRHRSMFLIDMAVPRDIEPAVGKLGGVYLFNMDDLQKVVLDNIKSRNKEAEKAEKLVDSDVLQFKRWMQSHEVTPTIKELRQRFVQVARGEAERTLSQLSSLRASDRKAVRQLADTIVNKLLHTPLMALKDGEAGTQGLVVATRRLFELSDPTKDEDESEADAESKSESPVPGTPVRVKT